MVLITLRCLLPFFHDADRSSTIDDRIHQNANRLLNSIAYLYNISHLFNTLYVMYPWKVILSIAYLVRLPQSVVCYKVPTVYTIDWLKLQDLYGVYSCWSPLYVYSWSFNVGGSIVTSLGLRSDTSIYINLSKLNSSSLYYSQPQQ